MDEERRKRMRRTTLDQLEEGRIFPVLETIESEGEAASAEASSSSASDEDFEYSDDEFLYGSINSGIDFWEDESYYDQEIEEDDVDPDELSYEELIALGEMVGVENRGLSEAEIGKYLHPLSCNSTANLLIDRCVVCQVEYEVGEELVTLQCNHPYHKDCISKWLQINKICPVCTNEVSSGEKTEVPSKEASKNGKACS